MDSLQTIKQRFSIIGNNNQLNIALQKAIRVAPTDISVLVTGESGVGKEVIPKIIHSLSHRKHAKYIAVNCGAIPEGTIDSELFGHEKGSFTGAHERKIGKFEFANGGTIFLDEISTMNTAMQIKLLRVLQDKTFYRVGSTVPIKVDVRIIAATNTDIEEEVKKGTFREDLFYRFNVLRINIPPLAKRPEDIEPLAIFFLKMYSRQFQKDILGFSDEALKALKNYHWPGNVRELKNIIERSIVLTENKSITLEDLPLDISIIKKYEQNKSPNMKETKKELDSYEKDFLIKRLKEYRWNKIKTANSLGIHRNTLLYKIKKFNILKETT
ncbi:MAG: sigma-54-dependent Fis family transcriptional regulator [Candidatus Aureabacteria bacterium]|nr:sigma-54-dependent Fis family transcriptional regulator [Candidatus Auribacterota bacterium]